MLYLQVNGTEYQQQWWSVLSRVLGRRKRKHRDWFDDQRDEIKQLLDDRNRRIEVYLRNASPENHALLREARLELQRELRRMKENWWPQLAEEIQGYADAGNQQEFYSALKGVYGAKHRAFCTVRGAEDRTLITDKTEILSRWAAEHYRDLLNRFTPTDPSFAESLPELPFMEDLDRVPTLAEVRDATLTLKYSKAPGPDSVPAEVLRYGGDTVFGSSTHLLMLHGDLVASRNSGGTRSWLASIRGRAIELCAGTVEVYHFWQLQAKYSQR